MNEQAVPVPDDFPRDAYEAVRRHVLAPPTPLYELYTEPVGVTQFRAAWDAVLYRYVAFAEHHASLTAALQRIEVQLNDVALDVPRRRMAGEERVRARLEAVRQQWAVIIDSSKNPDIFFVERELFGFFANGLSVIESLIYGLFAFGAIHDPGRFRLFTPAQRARVAIGKMVSLYEEWADASNTPLQSLLRDLGEAARTHGSILVRWRDTCELAAHRTTLPLGHSVIVPLTAGSRMSGRNQEPQIEFRLTWERFDIDPGSLAELRGWMSRQVSALISAFETFTASYPPHYDIEGTMRASSTDVFAPGAARVYGDVEYHPHGGTSMEPTIRNGEVVEVDVAAYRRRGPRRADLVLTRRPLPEKAPPVMKDSSTVLRVIALPGETVEVREGRVYVDGQPLVQPYVETPGSYSFAPKKVPRGKYFVLGDNRSRSADSHLFGWFRRTDIIGRVVLPNLD